MTTRILLAALLLLIGLGAPFAQLSLMGIGGADLGAAAPPACASPTAPNGVVDLSQCSNAFYVAVIF